jgi:hypothetical protein
MPSSALSDYTIEEKLAKELGLTHATLRKRRRKAMRTGAPLVPPYVEVARKIFYNNAGKAAWLKAIEQNPTPEKKLLRTLSARENLRK